MKTLRNLLHFCWQSLYSSSFLTDLPSVSSPHDKVSCYPYHQSHNLTPVLPSCEYCTLPLALQKQHFLLLHSPVHMRYGASYFQSLSYYPYELFLSLFRDSSQCTPSTMHVSPIESYPSHKEEYKKFPVHPILPDPDQSEPLPLEAYDGKALSLYMLYQKRLPPSQKAQIPHCTLPHSIQTDKYVNSDLIFPHMAPWVSIFLTGAFLYEDMVRFLLVSLHFSIHQKEAPSFSKRKLLFPEFLPDTNNSPVLPESQMSHPLQFYSLSQRFF